MFFVNFKIDNKFLISLAAVFVVAFGLIAFILSTAANDEVISTEQFISDLGYETEFIERQTVKIPDEFDAIYHSYNELQVAGGYDLWDYRGERVTLERYLIVNYIGEETEVCLNLLILAGEVIGGDISSSKSNGFITHIEENGASLEAKDEEADEGFEGDNSDANSGGDDEGKTEITGGGEDEILIDSDYLIPQLPDVIEDQQPQVVTPEVADPILDPAPISDPMTVVENNPIESPSTMANGI